MHLIVGLGNPGKKYERTRHNVGFLAVDALRNDTFSEWKLLKSLEAEASEGEIEGKKVILLKPQTFMNLSGRAVSAAMKKYRITYEHLIVIHDDLDIPFGEIKAQKNKSAAGHNGVQSVIDALGTKDFWRMRVGIGARPKEMASDVFVLQKFSVAEINSMKGAIIPEMNKRISQHLQIQNHINKS